jgi:prepilin-type N-terminal cleavage/methylation domain-containing protein
MLKHNFFSQKKGFTLLEILVVIGIIAVLVGLATTSYSTAQKKARDTKRKSDLRTIQNCLEQYYSYNNNFKYNGSLPTGSGLVSTGTLPTVLNCGSTALTTPKDPINDSNYQYLVTAITADSYRITATLEQGTIYEVTNQQ